MPLTFLLSLHVLSHSTHNSSPTPVFCGSLTLFRFHSDNIFVPFHCQLSSLTFFPYQFFFLILAHVYSHSSRKSFPMHFHRLTFSAFPPIPPWKHFCIHSYYIPVPIALTCHFLFHLRLMFISIILMISFPFPSLVVPCFNSNPVPIAFCLHSSYIPFLTTLP